MDGCKRSPLLLCNMHICKHLSVPLFTSNLSCSYAMHIPTVMPGVMLMYARIKIKSHYDFDGVWLVGEQTISYGRMSQNWSMVFDILQRWGRSVCHMYLFVVPVSSVYIHIYMVLCYTVGHLHIRAGFHNQGARRLYKKARILRSGLINTIHAQLYILLTRWSGMFKSEAELYLWFNTNIRDTRKNETTNY